MRLLSPYPLLLMLSPSSQLPLPLLLISVALYSMLQLVRLFNCSVMSDSHGDHCIYQQSRRMMLSPLSSTSAAVTVAVFVNQTKRRGTAAAVVVAVDAATAKSISEATAAQQRCANNCTMTQIAIVTAGGIVVDIATVCAFSSHMLGLTQRQR